MTIENGKGSGSLSGNDENPPTILYGEAGHPGVRLLEIARPEKMNAIGPREARGLASAIESFRSDPDARVLVITGTGSRAFCAGADLEAVRAMADETEGIEPLFAVEDPSRPESPDQGNIGPTRIHDLYKPVIAAVNGAAYAGGLEWACFAHLRIADRHASFGVTCRRWNIGLGDGGTQRLPRIVGMGRALDLILTGRVIGADEAEAIGLVNEVTPSGHCLERSLELAAGLAELPQEAMRTDLEAALTGFGMPLERGLEIERKCFEDLMAGAEPALGATRFVERRHPDLEPASPPLFGPGAAYAFAEEAQRGMEDRFGRPLIRHSAAVAELCVPLGDQEAMIAAYLHDAVEKGDASLEQLGSVFGPRIRQMVETLGQDGTIADRQARRDDHRSRVAASDPVTIAVYVNDRRDGIRTLTALVEQGRDPADFDALDRPATWRGDLAAISESGVGTDLLETMRSELERLETLLD